MPVEFSDQIWWVLAVLLVLGLPGAAWLAWLPGRRADLLERIADAVGLSIALAAVGALLGFLLEIRAGAYGIYGLALLSFVLFASGALANHAPRGGRGKAGLWIAGLGLIGLLGAIAWRLFQARGLVLPAWVDSVHHTLIVRKILETGGLPETLAPEILAEFTYHYGFHQAAALFAFWARALPSDAVLWFGQIINALVGLSVYRLGQSLWNDPRRSGLAALLVSFAFQMPAYYLTWGRYTLLTGLVLLPLAMAAALDTLREPRPAHWLRLALLTAGTALTHYTALLLLGFFMALLVLGWLLVRAWNSLRRRETAPDGSWPAAWAALGGVLLAVPWLVRVWLQQGSSAQIDVISPLVSDQSGYLSYIVYLLGPRHNHILLGLAGAGLIVGLFQPKTRLIAAWGLLLAGLSLPWGLRLGPFRPDHMAIVLFLPAAPLLANLVFSAVDGLGRLRLAGVRLGLQGIVVLAGLGLAAWGGWNTRNVQNSATIFVTPADLEAIHWVQENTPPEARFMFNTTPWMNEVHRGVDGGYWLESYAGRQTLLPPVLYTLGEPGYSAEITGWARRASTLTTCNEDFWSLARDGGAQYLYVRTGAGSLQPGGLENCPGLGLVYRRDGVFIYQMEN